MSGNNGIIRAAGILILLIAGVLLLTSCSEDCPSCPEPVERPVYRGYVYMSDYINKHIYQIDTETDSLIDSIACTDIPGYMGLSSDGHYLGVTFADSTLSPYTVIFDAQTLQELHQLELPVKCYFAPAENLLIGYYEGWLYFYSLPGFENTGQDSVGYFDHGLVRQSQGRLYGVGGFDSTYFMAYDYRDRQIAHTWRLHSQNWDWFYQLGGFDLSESADRLYVMAEAPSNSYSEFPSVLGYDLQSEEIFFRFPKLTIDDDVKLSPDGREVFFIEPSLHGGWCGGPQPGTVYIIDADNGSRLYGISLYGYREPQYNWFPLMPHSLAFAPVGGRIYLGTGEYGWGAGTLLSIDTEEREIAKLIWPDLGHYTWQIVLGPKL